MQHDLKWHETRVNVDTAKLSGWCICGGWTYQSHNLAQNPMVDKFIEHLDEIMPYVNHSQRHVDHSDQFFSN